MSLELPHLYNLFKVANTPLVNLILPWLIHNFIGYLDLQDIVIYFCYGALYGHDYQICYIISILKSMEQIYMKYAFRNDFYSCILLEPV